MSHVVIGRAIQSGLSSMTEDWCAEMQPDHVIVIDTGRGALHLDRFVGRRLSVVQLTDWRKTDIASKLLAGHDLAVGFETFYRDDFPELAAAIGVKTVMFPMWECSPEHAYRSTITINVTDCDQANNPAGLRHDWPITDAVVRPRQISRPPRRFVCNHGYGGQHRRNNTEFVIRAAIGLVGTGAKLYVRACERPKISDIDIPDTVEFIDTVPERADLYDNADVIVCPIGIEGLSLPTLEAAANGIPVIGLDLPQYSDWPHRITAIEQTGHGWARGIAPVFRPSVQGLSNYMRAMAMGTINTFAPPRPARWDEFRPWFVARLTAAGVSVP